MAYRCVADVALLRDLRRDGDRRWCSTRPCPTIEQQSPWQHWQDKLSYPLRSKGHSLSSGHQPESVLEAGEEAGGDAESRVQEVFVLYKLQIPEVSVKLLWKVRGQRGPTWGVGTTVELWGDTSGTTGGFKLQFRFLLLLLAIYWKLHQMSWKLILLFGRWEGDSDGGGVTLEVCVAVSASESLLL